MAVRLGSPHGGAKVAMKRINGVRLTLILALGAGGAAAAETFRDRLPQDEVIYFLLPDRFANGAPANDKGGLTGDRLVTGFDPTSKAFFHGGDLAGVRQQ